MTQPWPAALAAAFALPLLATPAPAQAVDADDLRPGLIATYRDPARERPVEVVRLEPTPAVSLGAGEAAHPRLSAAGGSARWDGYVKVLRAGPYRFAATLRGKVRVTVAGKPVLEGESSAAAPVTVEGAEVSLTAGALPVLVEFTRLPGPARMELRWWTPFSRDEPPAFDQFGHLPPQAGPAFNRDRLADQGRLVAEEHGCVNCHRPAASDKLALGLTSRQGPDLRQVGGRVYAGWLYRWLLDPHALRPATVMPRLFAGDEAGRTEAYAVARYLTSLGGPLKPVPAFTLSKEENRSADRGRETFVRVGCVACHRDATPAQAADAPSFYDTPTTYPLGTVGNKMTPDRLAAYLSNPHATDPGGRMPNMLLQGTEATDLARFLGRSRDLDFSANLPDAPAAERQQAAWKRLKPTDEDEKAFRKLSDGARWVELGRRLATAKGCANCHQTEPAVKPLAAPALAGIRHTDGKGCLAAKPTAPTPVYGLSAPQREAVAAFLDRGLDGAGSPAPTFQAHAAVNRFGCLNCHQRDGQGGLSVELTEQLRRSEKAENQDAVTPPPLTGVGHKLRTPWLKQVLTGGGRARPWMGLRMPQYGEANVGFLAVALCQAEGSAADDTVYQPKLTTAAVSAGRQLIGRGGFSCVSCHDIAGQPNSGTRGPDLATTTQRVRHDWYRRWLEQPQRMQPGTRMPTVFPDGRSPLAAVLGGSADAQAEAMWAYCSLGPGLPLPEGLEPPKGLVVAVKDRPELLRTFLPEAGSRGIAVGYPEGVSVAFDAATCRLAYAWSGNFLDASPVWNNRGGAPAKLLGPRFWTAPPGPPWAVTSSAEPPDFADRARDPAFGGPPPEGRLFHGDRRLHFDGYAVGPDGRPTFRYRIDGDGDGEGTLAVRESVQPLRSPVASGLVRRFALEVPAGRSAWLLVAESGRLLRPLGSQPGGSGPPGPRPIPASMPWAVPQDDGRVMVLSVPSAPAGARWKLRPTANGWQVLLGLPASPEASKREVAVQVWVVPRDEPALIKEVSAGSR
jgi:cytochrome c551/c552